MKRILYLECNSGISGDMTVGALLDLGADREVLVKALESLSVDGYRLHFGRRKKNGLDAFDFDVILEDRDGEREEEACGHGHSCEAEQGHVHEHEHSHGMAPRHSHPHRRLFDIHTIIDRIDSNDRVKSLAKQMFEIVAEAEAKAHGVPIGEVHFHEVGAVDSIVDIISTAVCVDNLRVDEVVVSPLAEGFGNVRCQHGVITVPVPATANIAAAYGLTLRLTDNEGEMVTPTGAAIAAALKTAESLPPSCRIVKIGMGAGKKEFKQANVLRAMLLETGETEEAKEKQVWVLETNLDDCTGEALGLAMELLFQAGALDVWNTPVYMKKNRPAYLLSLLCRKEQIGEMEQILFSQTTTIGVRRYPVFRTVLSRENGKVNTRWGEAKVKVCARNGQLRAYPEFESVRKICLEKGENYQKVYTEVQRAGEEERGL